MTGLRPQGLLVIKLRSPGPLQSGELREASNHEIVMSLWPPISQNRMKPDNVSSQTFPPLCLTPHSSWADRLGGG